MHCLIGIILTPKTNVHVESFLFSRSEIYLNLLSSNIIIYTSQLLIYDKLSYWQHLKSCDKLKFNKLIMAHQLWGWVAKLPVLKWVFDCAW